jgi:uncharacterized protein
MACGKGVDASSLRPAACRAWFDFAGFGENQGEPRQAEIPSRKIEDLLATVNLLATLSFIAPGGVGHVAIGASAQYALHAMARGPKATI